MPISGRRSLAKKRGSFTSGMKICGWRRSISYSAVVPLLCWPTTKKSGILPRWSCRGCSVEVVIAPQRDEVAAEVLADCHDLMLEAPAQLEHQGLVGGRRGTVHDAPQSHAQYLASKPPRRQRLQHRLCGSRGGAAPDRQRM